MKKTFILIAILFFYTVVTAQKKVSVGFLGGVCISNFYDYDVDLKKANLISYSLGGDIGYLINEKFSIKANLLYEVKGEETNIQPLDFYGNRLIGSTNFNLNYLTLNLLARGSFGKKIRFIAEGGPYIGYLLSAKTVGKNTTGTINGNPPSPISRDITSGYKSTNFGIVAGMGLEYMLNTKVSISLTIRRSLGLSVITKENSLNSNLKTNSLLGLVGVNFNL